MCQCVCIYASRSSGYVWGAERAGQYLIMCESISVQLTAAGRRHGADTPQAGRTTLHNGVANADLLLRCDGRTDGANAGWLPWGTLNPRDTQMNNQAVSECIGTTTYLPVNKLPHLLGRHGVCRSKAPAKQITPTHTHTTRTHTHTHTHYIPYAYIIQAHPFMHRDGHQGRKRGGKVVNTFNLRCGRKKGID